MDNSSITGSQDGLWATDSQREDSLIVKLTWISNQHDHVNGFFLSCNSLYNSYIIIKPTGSLVVG